jgi:hypothetical protein
MDNAVLADSGDDQTVFVRKNLALARRTTGPGQTEGGGIADGFYGGFFEGFTGVKDRNGYSGSNWRDAGTNTLGIYHWPEAFIRNANELDLRIFEGSRAVARGGNRLPSVLYDAFGVERPPNNVDAGAMQHTSDGIGYSANWFRPYDSGGLIPAPDLRTTPTRLYLKN